MEVSQVYIEELKAVDHFSTFSIESEYVVLIIRGLQLDHSGLGFESIGLVISKDQCVYEYCSEIDALKVSEIEFSKLHDFVSALYKKNQSIVEAYYKELSKLEEVLYERQSLNGFITSWFDLKKDLSKIEKYYQRNISVLESFFKYSKKSDIFEEQLFDDLIHHVKIEIHILSNKLDKLDALYNFYTSYKTDKLNGNIYTLTILSAVFLPLNLIVGFFGMNTENLFFKDNSSGTLYVSYILIGSFLLLVLGFPIAKIINSLILDRFFGRYRIYKNLTHSLKRIETIFKEPS